MLEIVINFPKTPIGLDHPNQIKDDWVRLRRKRTYWETHSSIFEYCTIRLTEFMIVTGCPRSKIMIFKRFSTMFFPITKILCEMDFGEFQNFRNCKLDNF